MRCSLLPYAVVSISAVLCACGFMTPAQQYPGEKKDGADIAVVQSYLGSAFGDEYHATISGYSTQPASGSPVVKHLGLPGFTDYPREIHLDPGHYVLELYCFKSLTQPTYRPTFDISVKAGRAYTVKCDAGAGKAAVSVSQETRSL